jgi:ABC transporter substrate binding protein
MSALDYKQEAQCWKMPGSKETPGVGKFGLHWAGVAKGGVLMNYGPKQYGPKQEEYFPRAIQIADRILRGGKVGNIPIERPVRVELVLNLKTAKALGIAVPPMLLARAVR